MTIFGQKTGAAAATTGKRTPTTAPDPGGWTNLPANVLPFTVGASTIDADRYASRALTASQTTSVALGGYPGAAGLVPAGSTAISYALKVAHQETSASVVGNINVLSAAITGCTVPALTKRIITTATPVVPVTDTVALTGVACIAALQNPFTVTFTASASASGTYTENLDGIDLVVTYTPPVVRAENGCTIVINSCSLLTVGGTQAKFVSWGTVYAPLGRVTVNVTDTADVVSFRRGVIARAISIPALLAPNTTDYFCLAAGSPCTGSTGAAGLRTELLTASVSGNVELRALVSFVDTPTPGTSLQIVSWNVLR